MLIKPERIKFHAMLFFYKIAIDAITSDAAHVDRSAHCTRCKQMLNHVGIREKIELLLS